MAFSSRGWIPGEGSMNLSPPVVSLSFSKMEISSRTQVLLLTSGSVHSGSASRDNSGRAYPDELQANLFPRVIGSHTMHRGYRQPSINSNFILRLRTCIQTAFSSWYLRQAQWLHRLASMLQPPYNFLVQILQDQTGAQRWQQPFQYAAAHLLLYPAQRDKMW